MNLTSLHKCIIDCMDDKKKLGRFLPDGTPFDLVAWRAVRKRAIASKEPYCAICNGYIDITTPKFEPLACEVDHIVPISRGGAPYDIENVQLSHSRCNRKKSNRMRSDYDGLDSASAVPLSNNW